MSFWQGREHTPQQIAAADALDASAQKEIEELVALAIKDRKTFGGPVPAVIMAVGWVKQIEESANPQFAMVNWLIVCAAALNELATIQAQGADALEFIQQAHPDLLTALVDVSNNMFPEDTLLGHLDFETPKGDDSDSA